MSGVHPDTVELLVPVPYAHVAACCDKMVELSRTFSSTFRCEASFNPLIGPGTILVLVCCLLLMLRSVAGRLGGANRLSGAMKAGGRSPMASGSAWARGPSLSGGFRLSMCRSLSAFTRDLLLNFY